MQVRIADVSKSLAAVEIFDNDGAEHHLVVRDDGSIPEHATEAYPTDATDRTEDEERTIRQVRSRALYAVHTQTGLSPLESNDIPSLLEHCAEEIRELSPEAFADLFQPLYDTVRDIDAAKSTRDISSEVLWVTYSVCLEADNRLMRVAKRPNLVYRTDDSVAQTGPVPGTQCPGETTPVVVVLVSEFFDAEIAFPEEFQEIVVTNLRCQARDVFRGMGEEPPERFDIEGPGKPLSVDKTLTGARVMQLLRPGE